MEFETYRDNTIILTPQVIESALSRLAVPIQCRYIFIMESDCTNSRAKIPKFSIGGPRATKNPCLIPIEDLYPVHRSDIPSIIAPGWTRIHSFIYVLGSNKDAFGWEYRSDWQRRGDLSTEPWVRDCRNMNVRRRVWMTAIVPIRDAARAKRSVYNYLQSRMKIEAAAFLVDDREEGSPRGDGKVKSSLSRPTSSEIILKGTLEVKKKNYFYGSSYKSRMVELHNQYLQLYDDTTGDLEQSIPLVDLSCTVMIGGQVSDRNGIICLRNIENLDGDVRAMLHTENKRHRKRWQASINYQIAINCFDLNFPPFEFGPPEERENPYHIYVYGYLLKQGHVNPNWKRRYFALHPYEVVYYENEHIKGRIMVTKDTEVFRDDKDVNAFKIVNGSVKAQDMPMAALDVVTMDEQTIIKGVPRRRIRQGSSTDFTKVYIPPPKDIRGAIEYHKELNMRAADVECRDEWLSHISRQIKDLRDREIERIKAEEENKKNFKKGRKELEAKEKSDSIEKKEKETEKEEEKVGASPNAVKDGRDATTANALEDGKDGSDKVAIEDADILQDLTSDESKDIEMLNTTEYRLSEMLIPELTDMSSSSSKNGGKEGDDGDTAEFAKDIPLETLGRDSILIDNRIQEESTGEVLETVDDTEANSQVENGDEEAISTLLTEMTNVRLSREGSTSSYNTTQSSAFASARNTVTNTHEEGEAVLDHENGGEEGLSEDPFGLEFPKMSHVDALKAKYKHRTGSFVVQQIVRIESRLGGSGETKEGSEQIGVEERVNAKEGQENGEEDETEEKDKVEKELQEEDSEV